MRQYELVIFDLDGTLLNTLSDLTSATNRALSEAGFPDRTSEEVRQFIGGGVGRLIHKAVPAGTPEAVEQAILLRFKTIYSENVNVHTQPYPGIAELLSALRSRGIHTACNSNKVDQATKALCRAHFGDSIEIALGERPEFPKKPSPEGAQHIMRTMGIDSEHTLYVGDGDADILTAKNAGIDCAWVTWGFRHADELSGLQLPPAFDTAQALMAHILGQS